MAKKTYNVIRPHQGDRWYEQGETREAEPVDVKHLVPGTLVLAKAEPTPQNKAAPAPKNKAR
ncbi:hypothetical protein [Rhizobium laguerreae]|uniref:DUF2635 domain-containing protein n=1 Tax=Rhizobium laguerreae TaxID=1076926 RepID=A0AAX2QLQ5_9HYPH|nr:hypothetical protein [Rhizobium laguerreae]TCU25291.1 hypothetical protein EV131_105405 [Rhizobium laguerreae]